MPQRSSPPAAVMTAADLDLFLATAFPTATRPFRVVEVTDLGAVVRMPLGREHERPGGTASGPAMMGLADGAAWVATLSRIGPVALAVTSSLTINFLRKPPMHSDLRAEAELIRLGRRLSVTDVRIFSVSDDDDDGAVGGGALMAQSSVTYAIPA